MCSTFLRSGFYGSGKSHLAKMLRAFWVDVGFADGAAARSLAKLPTDVESVIRKIILQKTQSAIPAIQQTLTDNLGEISRHLRGTKLEHSTEDETFLVDDYPLLPVRLYRDFATADQLGWDNVIERARKGETR